MNYDKKMTGNFARLYSYPAEDGYRMPAEFEPQSGCMMIWPWRPGSWRYDAMKAREAFCEIIWELAKSEEVYVLVREQDMDVAREMLFTPMFSGAAMWIADRNKIAVIQRQMTNIRLISCDSDDAWARDTGATFVTKKEITSEGETIVRRGIDWKFNAWGGDVDGLYASWEKDQQIASKICEVLGDDCYDQTDFVLEGGSIHTDGEGTLLTTEECLLSAGRNPHLSKEDIEEKLYKTLGVSKIIWLPMGIYNDETNGHIDNICAFTAPGEVVLAWTDDPEDPQYERSMAAYEVLKNTRDALGRELVIHKLPIPVDPICITQEDLAGYDFEDGEDTREVGERLAASYVNFYIGNDSVLVPQFDDIHDQLALQILAECFPTRRIVPIDATEILAGGGNIHCITQQIPGKTETGGRG